VTIVGIVAIISNVIYWFDKYLIDGAVNLVGLITVISGQSLKYNTSGQTQYYFLSILLGVALFVGIICLPLITPLF
jgi:NAD(P)H-quinone oxidoreductase subunit 5